MTRLVYNRDKEVGLWVAQRLKIPPFDSGLSRCIGVTSGEFLIAGIVYTNYITDAKNSPLLIEMTIASVDKSWCSRHNLNQLFYYPFCQIGVKRVQATCGRKAKRTRKFLERLGFVLEGIQREANLHGGDNAHYSMLKHECKWIEYEQENTVTSASTRPNRYIGSADAGQQGYRPL